MAIDLLWVKIPEGLDLIKIKQEARQKLIDQNKVIEFPQKRSFGEEVDQMIAKGEVNIGAADKTPPYKPSKSQSDFEIQTRIESDNAKAIEAFKKRNPKDDMATGGRAGYYGGGITNMVGEDLSEIGHGSDALMARNMQIAPGGQATTSTGLNYLLGQDNDTARVPYGTGKKVKGPNPKVLELMLNEKMSYEDAEKEFKIREKQRPYIEERMGTGPGPILEAAEGGRIGYNKGKAVKEVADKGRRGFMKAAGVAGAGIAALKTGLLGFADKAAPVVEKVAEAAGQTPEYFFQLVEKIKALGTVSSKLAVKDKEIVTTYSSGKPGYSKDYTLTEDITTGEMTIQRTKMDDDLIYDASEYYGRPIQEEVYMSYKPGKGLADETTKGKNIPDEYTEDTSLIRNDKPARGEISDTFDGVPDDILKEVEAGSGNVPDSFYTGPNAIKKADGGRIGYNKGKFVKEGIEKLIKAGEGKFTKAQYLIERIKNTIKGSPDDKYVQETFPGFIDELTANPELAKNENVFKQLGGDLPKGQQIVVYGDDTLDFFTTSSGPQNIKKLENFMAKHDLPKDQALRIMKMEPNDQVMELTKTKFIKQKRTDNSSGGLAAMLGE